MPEAQQTRMKDFIFFNLPIHPSQEVSALGEDVNNSQVSEDLSPGHFVESACCLGPSCTEHYALSYCREVQTYSMYNRYRDRGRGGRKERKKSGKDSEKKKEKEDIYIYIYIYIYYM